MGAHVLATQGARASATMILTTLNRNNSIPGAKGLNIIPLQYADCIFLFHLSNFQQTFQLVWCDHVISYDLIAIALAMTIDTAIFGAIHWKYALIESWIFFSLRIANFTFILYNRLNGIAEQ